MAVDPTIPDVAVHVAGASNVNGVKPLSDEIVSKIK
jgi:hypothetical protein